MTDFLLNKACNSWVYTKRRDSAYCVRYIELSNLMNKELVQKVRCVFFSCSLFFSYLLFANRTLFIHLPSSIEMCRFSNDRFIDMPFAIKSFRIMCDFHFIHQLSAVIELMQYLLFEISITFMAREERFERTQRARHY